MAADLDQTPRPDNHPNELPWPPVRPEYPPDSPALVHKPSEAPFNLDAAAESFGKSYVETLRTRQSAFLGDWWLLALLCRCSEVAQVSDDVAARKSVARLWHELRTRRLPSKWRPHLERSDLSAKCLAHMDFSFSYFDQSILSRAQLEDSRLSGASLDGADLSESRCSGATFDGATLTNARLDVADLSAAILENAKARGSSLECTLLHGASIAHADLSLANLRHARLVQCQAHEANLEQSDLRDAVFERASLSGVNFRRANASRGDWRYADISSAKITGAKLIRAKGLFGHSRAIERGDKINEHESQDAIYRDRWDALSWERLRFIGGLRLFGVSYLSIAAITLYAAVARQYNLAAQGARLAAHGAQDATDASVSFWSQVLSKLPFVPLPGHLGNQLIATIGVAIAATLYALACPAEVKEANEVRWTRAMGQPLWEYRSANWSRPALRYACGVLFGIGGFHSLYYLMHRSWNAISYLLFGS